MGFLQRLRIWRADGAALALGALSALALPSFFWVPVLLVAIPGLLALIEGARTPAVAWRRGFLFGLAHHCVGLFWITSAILIGGPAFWWAVPLAVPLLAAVLAVFIAVPCALAKRVPAGVGRVLLLAGFWVLADVLRQFVGTGFPWNPLGSVWEIPGVVGDIFIQPASLVGVDGLTFFTLLLASVPALGWRARAAGLAALVVWVGFGWERLRTSPTPTGLKAVIVQGNIPADQRRQNFTAQAWADQTFEKLLALTQAGARAAGGSRFVVIWPEAASPFMVQQDAGARLGIAEAARPALASLIGSVRVGQDRHPHNSLIALGPSGGVEAVYDKSHLVPWGEYRPGYLPVRIGEEGFAAGPGVATIGLAGLPPFGALICYEAIFSGQVVDPGRRPGFLVNITNDAWYGDTSGPRQHLAAARMRAVEEGLPLLRAANTGISAVIDSDGRVLQKIDMDRAGYLVKEIPGMQPPTVFSRWGLIVPILMAALGCVTAVVGRAGLEASSKRRLWWRKRRKFGI